MIDTREMASTLGRRNIASAVGVGLTAVSNHVVGGLFPASWYLAILFLCEQKGTECPERLFAFIDPPEGAA
jgi:hypothetical protein